VLVVVDGVRVEESIGLEPSELDGLTGPERWPLIHSELIPQGTLFTGFRNMGTTITAPAHATLATGTRTPLANMAVDNGAGLYRPLLPTVAEELQGQSGGHAVWMANQTLISPMTKSLMPGFSESPFVLISDQVGETQPAQLDTPVWPKLHRTLTEERPQLVMVNLKGVDRSGHYGEPGFEPYLEAIAAVDAPLVRLWDFIQNDPWYADDTVLIITTDHGRHRIDADEDDYWRNHGDWSAGDREGFVLMLGPDVLANQVNDTPYAMEDLAPTIAALTGVDLPWGDGLVMREGLSVYPSWPDDRSGVASIAADGGFVVEQVFSDEPSRRSVIRYGGKRLSWDGAWSAEGPVVAADGDRAAVCWREVAIDAVSMPWLGRCALVTEDSVEDIHFPAAAVSGFWEPDLRWVEGELHVAWAHNPYDIAQIGIEGDVGARTATWNGVWSVVEDPRGLLYPASVQHAGGSVVYIASPQGNDARAQRRLYIQELGLPAVKLETPLAQPVAGDWMVAQAAVRGTRVLGIGVGDTERVLFEVNLLTGQDTVLLRDENLPVHVAPVWAGSTPVWALQGERAEVCTADGCLDVGSHLRDMDWDGEELWVVVRDDDGPWTSRAL
jgi:hypothetical protein